MASRITFFDHFMRPVDQMEVSTTPRSWIYSGVGRAEFTISTKDPKALLRNLEYGNLVLIEHIPAKDENGNVKGLLPDWIGYILPLRNWDLGMIHVVAFTAEAVLSFRPMPFISLNGTPAAMFRSILRMANDIPYNGIMIQPGAIEDKTVELHDDLRLSAADHFDTLAKNADMTWDVTGKVDDHGNLLLFANLYTAQGVDTKLALDTSNTELGSPQLSEQGNPNNYIIGYSYAFTPNDRVRSFGIDQASIDRYGVMGMNYTFTEAGNVGSVNALAKTRVSLYAHPVKIAKRTAVDKGNLFSFLAPGNIFKLKDPEVGFKDDGSIGLDVRVRILSVDYNDLTNKCPLNLEVL